MQGEAASFGGNGGQSAVGHLLQFVGGGLDFVAGLFHGLVDLLASLLGRTLIEFWGQFT